MGAYAPVPWFGREALERIAEEVFEPIAWRMSRDEMPYRGVLYAGLMLTADGPMVLEFNARFGDPEAQVLLPLLDGDLASALLGCATGRPVADGGLGSAASRARRSASLSRPRAIRTLPISGRLIEGAEPSSPADDGDVLCFHAGASAPRGRPATRRPGGAS